MNVLFLTFLLNVIGNYWVVKAPVKSIDKVLKIIVVLVFIRSHFCEFCHNSQSIYVFYSHLQFGQQNYAALK